MIRFGIIYTNLKFFNERIGKFIKTLIKNLSNLIRSNSLKIINKNELQKFSTIFKNS